jgi:signal transduction histidine kinase/putative methionine-R-sulfoxide reductase with GAF domain
VADLSFLIISNDQFSIDEMVKKLTEMEYETSTAGSEEEASKLIQSRNYDVIVIDMTGEKYIGIDVLRKTLSLDMANEIIGITDSKNKKEALRLFGSEIWAFIDKPIDLDEFEVIVNRINNFSCLRREVMDKSRKLSHLEALNEIAREALLTQDEDSFLWSLARMINERFNYFNVNIFLMNETKDRLVLKAFAGGFGTDFVVGYSQALGEGVVGWVARNRQSLNIGDVRKDPRRIQGFTFEEPVLSELAVPIIFENKIIGVLHVESLDLNAFNWNDLITLETIADQIALSFEKSRLSHELIFAHQLSAVINDSLPVSIVIVDRDLNIEYVNRTFYEMYGLKRESFLKRPINEFFSKELMALINMESELAQVIETGNSISHSNIQHTSPQQPEKVITIAFFRVQTLDYPRGMILIQDVTDYAKKTYQFSLLREITLAMQGVLERDKLLHLILTCVTAGFAIGFNRAFLFLVDKEKNELRGIMGVGPTSQDEAYRIWNELSINALTFEKYLENINKGILAGGGGLQKLVESLTFNLVTTKNVLTETVHKWKSFHIIDPWGNPLIDDQMKKLIISREFVSIPLIVKNEVIGILVADNAFSGRPITDDSIEVLTMFASQAAIAIENAQILQDLEDKIKELQNAYHELEKAQDMIIRNEKLAAIGEVSARLAHEIRNPLATIGGFAKSIQKKHDDRERTIRNANIIVEEVQRLEHILSNVLDFTKTGIPKKVPGDINNLIRKTISSIEANVVSKGVVVVLDLAEGKMEAEYDEAQIKQVLINVLQNSINAMPEGGAIELKSFCLDNTITIEIRDTGVGIPKQYLEEIFEPFFTTRGNGTGLGLSISQRIIQNHGGTFSISSKEGLGTTVAINLPKK